jgi:hypothetical protein
MKLEILLLENLLEVSLFLSEKKTLKKLSFKGVLKTDDKKYI